MAVRPLRALPARRSRRSNLPKYNNSFKRTDYREETIVDENGAILGTVRLKPSSVLWKPTGAHKFYSVALNDFTAWITAVSTEAKRVKS